MIKLNKSGTRYNKAVMTQMELTSHKQAEQVSFERRQQGVNSFIVWCKEFKRFDVRTK